MALRTRVFTGRDFSRAKGETHPRSFPIEDECPTPLNGFSSFVAVKDDPIPDSFELVTTRSRAIERD